MANNTMRIRLKAYEHRILDESAKKSSMLRQNTGLKKSSVQYRYLRKNK